MHIALQNLYKRFLEARILLQKVILRSNELKLPPQNVQLPKVGVVPLTAPFHPILHSLI